MDTEGLKILLALEPKWTVSLNGLEFFSLASADLFVDGATLCFARYSRKIVNVEWLRPNVVRIQGQAKFRTRTDTITLYPGERLPSVVDLRRKRRAFQVEIGRALCTYFGSRKIERQTLF